EHHQVERVEAQHDGGDHHGDGFGHVGQGSVGPWPWGCVWAGSVVGVGEVWGVWGGWCVAHRGVGRLLVGGAGVPGGRCGSAGGWAGGCVRAGGPGGRWPGVGGGRWPGVGGGGGGVLGAGGWWGWGACGVWGAGGGGLPGGGAGCWGGGLVYPVAGAVPRVGGPGGVYRPVAPEACGPEWAGACGPEWAGRE